MTQSEIDIAVAGITGETLCTVQQRGFGIADPTDVHFDPEPYDRPRYWSIGTRWTPGGVHS
jgi:hypothetical protein